jgi:hypothetical protein
MCVAGGPGRRQIRYRMSTFYQSQLDIVFLEWILNRVLEGNIGVHSEE